MSESEDEERPAGTVEARREEIGELEGELRVPRAWRVVHCWPGKGCLRNLAVMDEQFRHDFLNGSDHFLLRRRFQRETGNVVELSEHHM